MKSGLEPARFVATGVLIALLIDLARPPAYAASFRGNVHLAGHTWTLVAVGTLCAFAGAFWGVRYLKKATSGTVRAIVATAILAIGAALIAGLLG